MPEVIYNGTKFWPGTQVLKERAADGSDLLFLVPPGGVEQQVRENDTLVVDGRVINGPMKGRTYEDRRVGPGVLKQMFTTGRHDILCVQTEDGWICESHCSIADVPVTPNQTTVVDDFFGVSVEYERRWLSVFWKVSRRSKQRTFVNGRCRKSRNDEKIVETPYYHGKTWTKWGARRMIDKVLEDAKV